MDVYLQKETNPLRGEVCNAETNEKSNNIVFIENSVAPEFISDIKWADPIEPQPINDYEKSLLKDTLNVTELLEKEKLEQNLEETEEQKLKRERRDYITKVKVVALDKIDKFPLDNPSNFSTRDKKQLIKKMQEIMTLTVEEITELFNEVCSEVIFAPESDYTRFHIYNI